MNQIRSKDNHGAYCWQEKDVLRAIRERYKSKRLTTAIAIYTVLTEIASNQTNYGHCIAYYSQIGNYMGKSSSTVKRYLNEFITMDIIKKQHMRDQKDSNIILRIKWFLLSIPNHNNRRPPAHNDDQAPSHDNEPVIEEHIKNNLYKKGDASIKEKTMQELIDWFDRAGRRDIATPECAQNLIRKYSIEKVKRSMAIHGSQGYGNPIDAFFKHLKDDFIGCGCKSPSGYSPV